MTDPAPTHKPAAPGEQRPVAMTPYAIAAACLLRVPAGYPDPRRAGLT